MVVTGTGSISVPPPLEATSAEGFYGEFISVCVILFNYLGE